MRILLGCGLCVDRTIESNISSTNSCFDTAKHSPLVFNTVLTNMAGVGLILGSDFPRCHRESVASYQTLKTGCTSKSFIHMTNKPFEKAVTDSSGPDDNLPRALCAFIHCQSFTLIHFNNTKEDPCHCSEPHCLLPLLQQRQKQQKHTL